ncbi:MAG: hypothetical protein ABIH38_01390 [Patescibacteria group bacterium]
MWHTIVPYLLFGGGLAGLITALVIHIMIRRRSQKTEFWGDARFFFLAVGFLLIATWFIR